MFKKDTIVEFIIGKNKTKVRIISYVAVYDYYKVEFIEDTNFDASMSLIWHKGAVDYIEREYLFPIGESPANEEELDSWEYFKKKMNG